MSTAEPEGFRDFVVARSPRLVYTAYLLTGDVHLAKDLVQSALARTWPHWERVRDGLDAMKPVVEGFDRIVDGAGVGTLFATPIRPRE